MKENRKAAEQQDAQKQESVIKKDREAFQVVGAADGH
jgi:hypothetical protein